VLPERIGRATRNAHLWLPGYVARRWKRRGEPPARRLWVTFTDHFEPLWQRPDDDVASQRVATWRREWPRLAARHQDSTGRPPQYGFFYPEEEYRPELLEPLAEMTRDGVGDVEVHLHHDADTSEGFSEKMSRFVETLHSRHGLLRRHDGRLAFGFIHGNWALDNSRPDGRWCGVNDEITQLRDLGCYADFTLPSAPNPCQTGPVNVIYRATDDPERPRSHARGVVVEPGTPAVGDLTLVTGPLALYWDSRQRKPVIDTGELAWFMRYERRRLLRWLDVAPRVGPEQFLKLYSHGAQDGNTRSLLLDGDLDRLFEDLREVCAERGTALRYVTAWEMWQAVEAAREGRTI